MTRSSTGGARLRALGLLTTAPAVALLASSPSTAWAALSSTSDPTAPLVGLVALLAWACTAWLTLLVALIVGSRVPGALGRLAARATTRLAPAPVRALVRVAVGTTVALSVLGGASSAYADAATPTTSSSSFEWPGATTTPSAAPELDWATPPASSAPVQVVPRPSAAAHVAVVRPPVVHPPVGPVAVPDAGQGVDATVVRQGDSLWSIAARSLGPSATPAQVAKAWPQWWSANRDVVGDHPELIHPGDHLAAPSH